MNTELEYNIVLFLTILYTHIYFYACISIAPILKRIQENDCQSTWQLNTRQKMEVASRTDAKDVLQRGLGKITSSALLMVVYPVQILMGVNLL